MPSGLALSLAAPRWKNKEGLRLHLPPRPRQYLWNSKRPAMVAAAHPDVQLSVGKQWSQQRTCGGLRQQQHLVHLPGDQQGSGSVCGGTAAASDGSSTFVCNWEPSKEAA